MKEKYISTIEKLMQDCNDLGLLDLISKILEKSGCAV